MMKYTTIEQRQLILEMHEKGVPISTIASSTNKHPVTIVRIIRKNGVIVNTNRLTSEQKQYLLQTYKEESDVTATKIANTMNKNPATIRRILQLHGIDTSQRRSRKHIFNQSKFKQINTHEKAYWLGFIMGDGCIGKNYLSLELSQVDRCHLEKIKKFMKGGQEIVNTQKQCCRIIFCSKKLVTDLAQYEIIKNKTHRTKTPKIESKYLPDFYRGILDSDGWICKHGTQHEFGFSSACESFLIEIKTWFNSQINTRGYLKERVQPNNHRVHQLIIGGNKNFVKIYNLLYTNANEFLDRKHEKIQGFLKTI